MEDYVIIQLRESWHEKDYNPYHHMRLYVVPAKSIPASTWQIMQVENGSTCIELKKDLYDFNDAKQISHFGCDFEVTEEFPEGSWFDCDGNHVDYEPLDLGESRCIELGEPFDTYLDKETSRISNFFLFDI